VERVGQLCVLVCRAWGGSLLSCLGTSDPTVNRPLKWSRLQVSGNWSMSGNSAQLSGGGLTADGSQVVLEGNARVRSNRAGEPQTGPPQLR